MFSPLENNIHSSRHRVISSMNALLAGTQARLSKDMEVNRSLHKCMYLFIYFAIAFHKLRTQTAAIKNFCFNASLEGKFPIF